MSTKKKVQRVLRRIFAKVLGLDENIYTASKEYIIHVSEKKKLQDKVAIVTGGSGAIGRACAVILAMNGAIVYIGGRNQEKMRAVVHDIEVLGGTGYSLPFDVTNSEAIDSAFEQVFNKNGSIDILVNCAGGGAREKANYLHLQNSKIVSQVITSNLIGSLYCCRAVAKYMVKQHKGKIINMSSTIGVGGMKTCVDYSGAKAGIIGFTKSLAMELGEYDVNVNCVSPGYIQRGEFNELMLDWLRTSNYMNKVGTMEDIANAVLFLATDDAAFITGQNIIVDGGRSLGLKGAE